MKIEANINCVFSAGTAESAGYNRRREPKLVGVSVRQNGLPGEGRVGRGDGNDSDCNKQVPERHTLSSFVLRNFLDFMALSSPHFLIVLSSDCTCDSLHSTVHTRSTTAPLAYKVRSTRPALFLVSPPPTPPRSLPTVVS